jgi:hypothetical protein
MISELAHNWWLLFMYCLVAIFFGIMQPIISSRLHGLQLSLKQANNED